MFCKNCGKEINDNAVVCVNCGCESNKSSDKWIVTLLLCFFFGTLGVHRFYTGYTGLGLLQLFLSIIVIGLPISMIWVLIDFISIIVGTYKTADGKPLKN